MVASGGRPSPARRARETLYTWVARNRYRWFGKQTACAMPTPELRSRFLDADEPRWVEPDTSGADASTAPSTGPAPIAERAVPVGLLRFGLRSLLVFLVLAAFPFPVGNIPRTERFAAALIAPANAAAAWMGRILLGNTVVDVHNGSGDSLARLSGRAAGLAAAIVGAAIWTLWRRNAQSLRSRSRSSDVRAILGGAPSARLRLEQGDASADAAGRTRSMVEKRSVTARRRWASVDVHQRESGVRRRSRGSARWRPVCCCSGGERRAAGRWSHR